MPLRILIYLIIFTLCAALPTWGVELTPFSVRNLSPPALIKSLPVAESVCLNQPRQFSVRFGFDISNVATDNDWAEQEEIVLDGEIYVVTLGLRYGLAKHLEIGFDLPWVFQNSGSLDNFIENFHDFFGLPNSDRNNMSNNKINYTYTNNDGNNFLLDHDTNSIGDIRLLAAWQWLDTEQTAARLQAWIKTPTGDSDKLTGSGGWDFSLSLSLQRNFILEKGSASLWGGFGGSWLDDGDVLPGRAENWVVSGWMGAGWSPLSWFGLKLQFDSHSALYDSQLRELGRTAMMLTIGGTLGLGDATVLDIGVGEDLASHTSPDMVFLLNLNHKF